MKKKTSIIVVIGIILLILVISLIWFLPVKKEKEKEEENEVKSRGLLYDVILEDNKDIGVREDYSSVFTGRAGLYKEEDIKYLEEDGRTKDVVYYYAGDVRNNWVKFGEYWWRIIRTNEDGSVRLLYAGEKPDITEGYIDISKFNNRTDNRIDVGYMFGETGTLEDNRKDSYSSIIKETIDNWYISNLKDKYGTYLSETAVYCNDRSADSHSKIYYAGKNRLDLNKRPSFKCGSDENGELYTGETMADVADRFTGSNESGVGNGRLEEEPIALMTADEIVYSGGVYGRNNPNYYYRNSNSESVTGGKSWWTMTSFDIGFDELAPTMFYVEASGTKPGYLYSDVVDNEYAVRPVLSLKSCIEVSGKGTVEDPYVPTKISDSCAKEDN